MGIKKDEMKMNRVTLEVHLREHEQGKWFCRVEQRLDHFPIKWVDVFEGAKGTEFAVATRVAINVSGRLGNGLV